MKKSKTIEEKLTVEQLWSRYRDSSMKVYPLKCHLNSLISDLHKTEIRIDYTKYMFNYFYRNADPKVIDQVKTFRTRPLKLYPISITNKLVVSGYDFRQLKQQRKDISILIKHYKKEYQENLIRMNRYLTLYRKSVSIAKESKCDIASFEVYITHVTQYGSMKMQPVK